MISFSTCWNSHRHQNGSPMLKEIKELGFDLIELGHGTRLSLMEGIQKRFDKGKVRFSSLHNFCPLPVEFTKAAPDCYQFSSPDQFERQRAIKHTRQTIDFAVKLQAPLIVLHLGSIRMESYTDRLIALAKQGKQFSREYIDLKLKAVQDREKRAPQFLKRTRESLREFVDYAGERGIKLGFEGRYGYEEIPNGRELLLLLEEFNFPHVGYWHDFGHIQSKHNLGFLDHAEWLEMVAPRYFGGHLHDVEWPANDHRVPFSGGIDYDRLIPILPKDALYVWELSPRRTAEEILAAREKWKARFPHTEAPAIAGPG